VIKSFFQKKSTKIIAIILFSVFFLLSLLTIISVIGYRGIFNHLKNYGKIESSHNLEVLKDLNNVTTIRNTDNDEGLKILQLTDSHIGCSIGTYSKDKAAFDAMYKIISNSKPDLIVITGDMCYPFFLTLGINNRLQAEAFATFFENIGIYWTVNFGNHEDMGLTVLNAEELGKYLMTFEHCLLNIEDGGITGESNYLIKVLNNDKTFNSGLVFLDSNNYIEGINNYDRIHDDQINWYKDTINNLAKEYNKETSKINTFLFIHIPLQVYTDAYNDYENGSKAEMIYGKAEENICSPDAKDDFFATIKKLGSTRAIFCGHDHLNYYSMKYEDIILSYGMSIDYLAYVRIHKKNAQRGGQLIRIKEDNTFILSQTPESNNFMETDRYKIDMNV